MVRQIKAVAVDIDGTITDQNRRLCCSAMESIRMVEKLGIPVIIVTGNIMCFTRATTVLLGTSGGMVAENGGVVFADGDVKVLGDIKKAQRAYEYLITKQDVHKVQFSELRVSEIAMFRTLPVKTIKETLKDFDVEIYDTKYALHLTDPEVNKGSSLKIVAKELGVSPKNIMAVGDSENDIDFLNVSGCKIAVSNADNELKEIADYVTHKSYGDGVKEAIERFVL